MEVHERVDLGEVSWGSPMDGCGHCLGIVRVFGSGYLSSCRVTLLSCFLG